MGASRASSCWPEPSASTLPPWTCASTDACVRESSSRLPCFVAPVAGDADQLAQLFQNLIDNALKYAKPSTVVRVTAEPAEPGRIAVAVSDEGDGIPAVHLPRLTERFYRVDNARSRQLGGTGLGLAIVKHVVNRHRGRLDIRSTPGKGSTFTVTLPAAG